MLGKSDSKLLSDHEVLTKMTITLSILNLFFLSKLFRKPQCIVNVGVSCLWILHKNSESYRPSSESPRLLSIKRAVSQRQL